MTPQEQELIQNVANKLKASPSKTKDADAERFIMQEIGSQEDIVYKLTQAVLVQEMALKDLKSKSDFLEQQVAHYKAESERGTFSRMMGGSNPAPVAPPPAQPSGFGSFMKTAAGVAVGMVAGAMITDALFGDDEPAAEPETASTETPAAESSAAETPATAAEEATAPVTAAAEEATNTATETVSEAATAVEEAPSSFLGESSGFASEFTSPETDSFTDGFSNAGFGLDDGFGAEESYADDEDYADFDEEI